MTGFGMEAASVALAGDMLGNGQKECNHIGSLQHLLALVSFWTAQLCWAQATQRHGSFNPSWIKGKPQKVVLGRFCSSPWPLFYSRCGEALLLQMHICQDRYPGSGAAWKSTGRDGQECLLPAQACTPV